MAGGGAGPEKAEEPAPHPPKDQLPNVSYCISSPPPWLTLGSDSFQVFCLLIPLKAEAILLGFQHFIVMLGTAVIIPTALVPQMGGRNTTCCHWRVIYLCCNHNISYPVWSMERPTPVARFKKIMRAIQGALIIASTLQIVLGFSGLWRNVSRFLSPLLAVPLVALAGFGLYEFGFPGVSYACAHVAKCVEIGLPQLVILIIFSQENISLTDLLFYSRW